MSEEADVAYFKVLLKSIHLEGIKKSRINFRMDNWSPYQDSKLTAHKYQAAAHQLTKIFIFTSLKSNF
jgi:hypothetical protein